MKRRFFELDYRTGLVTEVENTRLGEQGVMGMMDRIVDAIEPIWVPLWALFLGSLTVAINVWLFITVYTWLSRLLHGAAC